MNVVDSSGWLSYFADDKNAENFAKPIEAINLLMVPAITLTEVFKRMLQQTNENLALQAIAHMEQGKIISLDSTLAIEAARYGITYKLPLADSIIYATTQHCEATLWTQDTDFKNLENVKFFAKK